LKIKIFRKKLLFSKKINFVFPETNYRFGILDSESLSSSFMKNSLISQNKPHLGEKLEIKCYLPYTNHLIT